MAHRPSTLTRSDVPGGGLDRVLSGELAAVELGRQACRSRGEALDAVRAELAAGRPDRESAVAIRSYGLGRLAVGLAGPVDRPAADRLAALLREVHVQSGRELVLTFGLLAGPVHRHLARVVGRARMAHLVQGGQVELNDVPAVLLVELDLGMSPGVSRPTAFHVHDGDSLPPGSSGARSPGPARFDRLDSGAR